MFQGLKAKFTQHEDLREKLLSTGDAIIVEHTKKDTYWGDGGDQGTGEIGKNVLGKLLVRVREEIKKSSTAL